MSQKLYVANLPFSTDDTQVKSFFSEYGNVVSVNLIRDRETKKLRGFGFIEMDDITNALTANGKDFGGRTLVVNQAREREQRTLKTN